MKNKSLKIALFAGLFVFLGIFAGSTPRAFAQGELYTPPTALNGYHDTFRNNYVYVAPTASGYLTSITLNAEFTCHNPPYNTAIEIYTLSGSKIATSDTLGCPGWDSFGYFTNVTWNFSDPVFLQAGTTYKIFFPFYTTANAYYININPAIGGYSYDTDFTTHSPQIYLNGNINYIALNFPTATTTADFANWVVTYADNAGTPGYTHIGVAYSTDPAMPWGTTTDLDTTFNVVSQFTNGSFPKVNLLTTSTTYYAKAILYHGSAPNMLYGDEQIAVSPVTSFTISATSNTGCDPNDNFLVYGFCKVIRYLFYPSDNVLSNYSNLKNTLATKPPFGYFGAIKAQLDNLNATTTDSGLNMPDISIFNYLKNGIAIMIWIAFAFWVVYRMRHLEL